MNESSSNSNSTSSDSSSSSSFELISNTNIYLNNNEILPISSNSTNTNKWNEHYSAAYYGSADNYYRNLHYTHQSSHSQFHPQAYWLHAAAASTSEQSINSWQASINNSNLSSSNNPTLSINSNNSYYQIPQLNTTNLTAPSSSSSSSSSSSTSSSAANTPQSNNLNTANNHSDTVTALNNKLSLINQDSGHFISASAASNFSMHSQLVNAAYQSYTNNFVLPHSHTHYTHHQQQNLIYPPTPPKDSNNNQLVNFINRGKNNNDNNVGSLLTISQTVTDNVKSENFIVSPTCDRIETSSDFSNSANTLKKIKSESATCKRKGEIDILHVEEDDNPNENIASDEEYDEIEENEEEDDDDINDENSLDHRKNTLSLNRNNFISNNNPDWICNKNCDSANNFNSNGEKQSDQEKWVHNSSMKISNNSLNNKKKTLPGKKKELKILLDQKIDNIIGFKKALK